MKPAMFKKVPPGNMRLLSATGAAACVAGLLAHIGDMYTCFSLGEHHHQVFLSPENILRAEEAALMMSTKTYRELQIGQVLAMVFIPLLGIFGTAHLYLILRASGLPRWLNTAAAAGCLAAFFAGTAMHCSFTFLGLMARRFPGDITVDEDGDVSFASGSLLLDAKPFFDAVCHVTIHVLMPPALLGLTGMLAMGRTVWPRWMALVSPGMLQLYMYAAGLVLNKDLMGARMYLIVTAYNLSNGLFFGVSTLHLLRQRHNSTHNASPAEQGGPRPHSWKHND